MKQLIQKLREQLADVTSALKAEDISKAVNALEAIVPTVENIHTSAENVEITKTQAETKIAELEKSLQDQPSIANIEQKVDATISAIAKFADTYAEDMTEMARAIAPITKALQTKVSKQSDGDGGDREQDKEPLSKSIFGGLDFSK